MVEQDGALPAGTEAPEPDEAVVEPSPRAKTGLRRRRTVPKASGTPPSQTAAPNTAPEPASLPPRPVSQEDTVLPEPPAQQIPAEQMPAEQIPAQQIEEAFSEAIYLANNPDVAEAVAAGTVVDARSHWQEAGRDEQARGDRPSLRHDFLLSPPGHDADTYETRRGVEMETFDAAGYVHLYPDLRQAIGNDAQEARLHWLYHGAREGRYGPGWRPNAGRAASVAAVLERPFGIDLYAPFADPGPQGILARRLARALEAGGVPFALHGYDNTRARPRLPVQERRRTGGYRVALILADAGQTRVLASLLPPGRFAGSYVVGCWGDDLAALRRDGPVVFAMLDEVWPADEGVAETLGGAGTLPVARIALPLRPDASEALVSRPGVRTRLGLPEGRLLLLPLDGATANPVAGESRPPAVSEGLIGNAEAVIAQFAAQARKGAPAGWTLVVQLPAHEMATSHRARVDAAIDAASAPDAAAPDGAPRIVLIETRRVAEEQAALLSEMDALACPSGSLEAAILAGLFVAANKPVLGPRTGVLSPLLAANRACAVATVPVAVSETGGLYDTTLSWHAMTPEALGPAMAALLAGTRQDATSVTLNDSASWLDAVQARLRDLGLDARPLPFARHLGQTRQLGVPGLLAGLPPRSRDNIEQLSRRPFFSMVLVIGDDPPEAVARAIAALEAQSYAFRDLHIVHRGETPLDGSFQETLARCEGRLGFRPLHDARHGLAAALNAVADGAIGSHLVIADMAAGALPLAWALTEFAHAIGLSPAAALLYGDELVPQGEGGRGSETTRQRGAWDAGLISTALDLGGLVALRKEALVALGGFASDADPDPVFGYVLRLVRAGTPPLHVRQTLSRRLAAVDRPAPGLWEARARALRRHAEADGAACRVVERPAASQAGDDPAMPRELRLAAPLDALPPVSVAVTVTGAQGAQPLIALMQSLHDADYARRELLLIDDGDLPLATVAALHEHRERLGFTMVSLSGAAGRGPLQAHALEVAAHDHVLLLDPRCRPRDPFWLAALAEMALRERFGAAGVVPLDPAQAVTAPAEMSAVRPGCLLVDRRAAPAAEAFANALDADVAEVELCLRLRDEGRAVLVTPLAAVDTPDVAVEALLRAVARSRPSISLDAVRANARIPRQTGIAIGAPAAPSPAAPAAAPAAGADGAPPRPIFRPGSWRRTT